VRAGSGNTLSLWQATSILPTFESLRRDVRCDVAIVGAGITGLSCAYELARRGRHVVVIDEGGIGNGETSRTSAHLATGLDDRYYEIERRHGHRGALIAAHSHGIAIDYIEAVVQDENIDCDFARVPGYLIPGGDGSSRELDREATAAARAGLTVQRISGAKVAASHLEEALRFDGQAQFHPLRYLSGLAEACRRRGVEIYTQTRAVAMHGGTPAVVTTESGNTINADALIMATNSPINDRFVIHTKQAAYRTFVIAMAIDEPVAPSLIWDTEDPYHYVRSWRDEEQDTTWLIVGGEDHKTGQPDGEQTAFTRLAAWARERLGYRGDVRFAWSGQVIEPNDGLAFIGRNPADEDNVYIVTGDSGNGLTHGTLGAILIADQITGRTNYWIDVYSPSRKQVRALGEFTRENANVAAQYTDLVTGGEVDDEAAIVHGTGAIVRHGLHKIAAYRDNAGQLHAHSAVCTHLGCIVHWNSVERTWDCPCHGSRFDPRDGHVLNGPALSPLAPISKQQGAAWNVPQQKSRRTNVTTKQPAPKQPAQLPKKESERARPKDSDREDVRERGPDTGGGKLRPSDR
jgi:glycine/D-amino acid oxidase-like deaminating enzyme/nitrite reductase/ring-hydroxylating ferredoxin subunit